VLGGWDWVRPVDRLDIPSQFGARRRCTPPPRCRSQLKGDTYASGLPLDFTIRTQRQSKRAAARSAYAFLFDSGLITEGPDVRRRLRHRPGPQPDRTAPDHDRYDRMGNLPFARISPMRPSRVYDWDIRNRLPRRS